MDIPICISIWDPHRENHIPILNPIPWVRGYQYGYPYEYPNMDPMPMGMGIHMGIPIPTATLIFTVELG